MLRNFVISQFSLNSCSHSEITEFNELLRSIVVSFLLVFGAQREGSASHGGDTAAVSSADSYSSDTSSVKTRAQEFWVTSHRDLVHRGGPPSGGQTRRGEKVAVQECLSDVCDEVVNDEEHKNQRGLLPAVMESRLSPSPALTRIQCSRHVQGVLRWVERTERTRTLWRRLRWRRRRPQQRTQLPRKSRQSPRQGRQVIQEVPVPMMQPVQTVEKATGSSEDGHRQGA